MNDQLARLNAVRQRIAQACRAAGRSGQDVSLLAVSKRHSPEKVRRLHELGVKAFGENLLPEALEKQQALAGLDIQWHFIGAVQSNKTRALAEHFHWVQSVDREKILSRLSAQRPDGLKPLNVLLQVNIDREPQKSGALPEDLAALAQFASRQDRLQLRGLMCLPRQTDDPAAQHDSFRKVRQLFDQLKSQGYNIDTLSMGMSHDLEVAIAEGSTMVRIGTDLLGTRPS
jgi:pyridoxal phosphate enzyme (YggS family)